MARLLTLLILLLVGSFAPGEVAAQTALNAETRSALTRLQAGTATEADRAILFANNDAINAAGQNGSISDAAYQRAQGNFAELNQRFAKEAAEASGAKFTVQARSSETFVPGTDSDYITQVRSKDQIAQMQRGYNDKINEYLKQNGIEQQRGNWHNKLDTDFMADPDFIKSPEEFREIAALNNDAYKNRHAAEYERLSRSGGGKIGPEHVNGYMNEMNDFAQKKGAKIDKILAEPASYLNDPKNRAELFQAMAQEQKYTSRMESLDDFLRAQEGLPPRNRGTTISKLGSNRSAGNAANIRNANAVADASRFAALEDLAETMGQVAKKNPAFNPNAADDIAKIIEGLPPNRRAGVLSRIRANGGGAMMDDVINASRGSGRLKAGAPSLADDLIRAQSDELGRLANQLDGVSDVGKARKVMTAAMDALDTLGRVAATADVAMAANQLREVFDIRNQMLNPDITDAEAARLQARAQELAEAVRDNAALAAIMELSPHIAIAYGTWTVGCMAGEFRSPTREGSNTTCLDRQLSAFDHAWDHLSGRAAQRNAHADALCDKFRTAVDQKRVRPRSGYSVDQICGFIRYGNSIKDTYEQVPETERVEQASPSPLDLRPATCVPSENTVIIASLGKDASDGRAEAAAHIAMLRSVNGSIGKAEQALNIAIIAYESGDLEATRSSLLQARGTVTGLNGSPSCPAMLARIDRAMDQVASLERVLDAARSAVEACTPDALQGVIQQFGSLQHVSMQDNLRQVRTLLVAHGETRSARASFRAGDIETARVGLESAMRTLDRAGYGSCPSLRQKITGGLGKIDKLESLINKAEAALASCKPEQIEKWRTGLAKIANAAIGSIRGRLDRYKEICRKQRISNLNKRCVRAYGGASELNLATLDTDKPLCICKKNFQWNKANDRCVRKPSEAEQLAERNKYCKGRYGSGYFSGPLKADGQYHCVPNKKTASAWCNKNNPGSGYHAANIRNDGSFDCKRGKKAARADCRLQARKSGKVYAYTQFLKNGSYRCRWCEPGFRYRKGQCYPRQQRASNKKRGGSSRRNSGSLYSCVVYHPDGSILGTGGSYSTLHVKNPIPGARCERLR